MDSENIKKLLETVEAQQKQLNAILTSTEKTRKYFLWILIITVATVVLPLIGLLFAIPSFINTYTEMLNLSL
jgi:hypothetical protein